MSKRIFLLFVVCVVTVDGLAQKNLQGCSAQRHARMAELLFSGKSFDEGVDVRKLTIIDSSWRNCIKGKDVPTIKATSLDGEKINSDNLKGKIILINFWYIQCPPCVAEIPLFNKLAEDFKDSNVVFLAFSSDNKADLQKFIAKTPFDVTIIPNSTRKETVFGISEFPTSFLIDGDGKVSYGWVGGIKLHDAGGYHYMQLKERIEELLLAFKTK